VFKFDQLHKIEIELTTRCQASCPMCSRNFHGLLPNNNIKNIDWTFEDFIKIISTEVLEHVKIISFCGAYGDPLLCKDIIKICQYIKDNSNAEVRINTNGSFHNKSWWKQLAQSLPTHMVVFGIDGFKKNHELHRIGTDFDKIIKNAKSFIQAGGTAAGQFINFDYNKDDYDKLKIFLLESGFETVFKLNSNRFRNNSFPVIDKNNQEIYKLTPTNNNVVSFSDQDIQSIINKKNNMNINCRSMHQKEIYIDARKHLYPCCDTATIKYEIERINEPNFNTILPLLKNQIRQIHKDYNNTAYIDLTKVSIKEVLNDQSYLDVWKKYWDLKKSLVCVAVCGNINNEKNIDKNSQFVF